jgi:ubiquinone biosynthesis protein Coq4
MMKQPLAAPSPAPQVERFLKLIDRVSGSLGLNVAPIVNIQKLRSLPTGTFGRTWADFLDQHQLEPLNTGPRRKQLHDGIHVLTGYGTDPIGEAQVQAFLLGAKFSLLNLFLGLGLLRPIYRQLAQKGTASRHRFIKQLLWNAYQRGCHSRFDPDAWEPEFLWNLPLIEVQALFTIYTF